MKLRKWECDWWIENKLWYQELKDKVDNNILAYQDKRDYFWDKVNPEHLR